MMQSFSFVHLLYMYIHVCTFSEILMSNNSSIAIFQYLYILLIDDILLDRILMDFRYMYSMWGVY